MIALLFCLGLVVAVILTLLFMPMVIRIDTFNGVCGVRWGPVNAALFAEGEDLRYRLRAPFFRREGSVFDRLAALRRSARAEHKEDRSGEVRRDRRLCPGRFIRRLLASFRVRRFQWQVDTGDPLWNAWLFPLFHFWRSRGADVRISFIGCTGLLLVLENNAFRLLKAVLSEFINQPPQRHEQRHE